MKSFWYLTHPLLFADTTTFICIIHMEIYTAQNEKATIITKNTTNPNTLCMWNRTPETLYRCAALPSDVGGFMTKLTSLVCSPSLKPPRPHLPPTPHQHTPSHRVHPEPLSKVRATECVMSGSRRRSHYLRLRHRSGAVTWHSNKWRGKLQARDVNPSFGTPGE